MQVIVSVETYTGKGQRVGGETARPTEARRDKVEEASEDSFPASDAPAWRL